MVEIGNQSLYVSSSFSKIAEDLEMKTETDSRAKASNKSVLKTQETLLKFLCIPEKKQCLITIWMDKHFQLLHTIKINLLNVSLYVSVIKC